MTHTTYTYKRDESKVHYAPGVLIITDMFMTIATLILIIAFIITRITGLLIAILGILLLDTILSKYFTYRENLILKINNDSIEYSYNLNKSIVPSHNATVSIKANKIRKVVCFGKKIIIWGNITRKQPLKSPQKLSHISLELDFNENKSTIQQLIKDMV